MIRPLLAFLALIAAADAVQADCGATSEPCRIDGGEYHIALPPAAAPAPPVVLFLHGAGGTGRTMIGNTGLVGEITGRGYAVLAPTGFLRFGNGDGRNWVFYPGWQGRDEARFLREVVEDAAARFGTRRDRVLLAGFSAGGFMVNYLACRAPESFSAYASISGGFWRPHPEGCAGPVRLFHTHGWSDPTVPIEGRALRGGSFHQGDIFAGLEIWRMANRCTAQNPSEISETGPFWRRKWTRCAADSALEFALFSGGHTVPDGWADMVLDWFERVAPQ